MSDAWPDFGITAYYYGTVVPYIGRRIATESYAGLRPSASDFRMHEQGRVPRVKSVRYLPLPVENILSL